MSKTLAYLRTSTDKQDLNNQRLEILEYARHNDLHIDDFIEITISSHKSRRARRIEELLEKLTQNDTLIVTELSRLGRSTGEVITLIDELVANDITILILKQNLKLSKQNPQNPYPRSKLQGITRFCPYGYGFCGKNRRGLHPQVLRTCPFIPTASSRVFWKFNKGRRRIVAGLIVSPRADGGGY